MAGGGGIGGVDPIPPQSIPKGPLGTFAAVPGDFLRYPLRVAVHGPGLSYIVAVTAPTGAVVAVGTTDSNGLVSLLVPAVPGLELDVLGTSVVGVPVQAGQFVQISIP